MSMCCKWLIAEIILCVIAAIIAVVVVLIFNTNRKGVAHNANEAAKNEIKETRREFLKVAKEFLTSNWFLFFLLVILLGFDIYSRISFVCITNESIVLVFVGILATFVVISNYAQVKDLENKVNNQDNIIKKEIYEIQRNIIDIQKEEKIKLIPMQDDLKLILISDNKQQEQAIIEKLRKYGDKEKIRKLLIDFAEGKYYNEDFAKDLFNTLGYSFRNYIH